MQISRKATTIVEAVIVMTIIVLGVVGTYKLYITSLKSSITTSNRIQAISIAREGIEAVTNIRDTNWFLFPADTATCWNVDNYATDCITSTADIIQTGSYIAYTQNDRWHLEERKNPCEIGPLSCIWDYKDTSYLTGFIVLQDKNGFFTQQVPTIELDKKELEILNQKNKFIRGLEQPKFTREIKISYPNAEEMKVESIVKWIDQKNDKKSSYNKVIFSTTLTNRKK